MISRLGWKKDKFDKRDYKHMFRAVPVPSNYVLPVIDVRDQGNLRSCVGFGVGGNISGLALLCNVFTEWFSPLWIYNGARFIEGTLNEDSGAYPRDGFEWLRNKGCLLEHFWPYTDKLDPSPPPSKFNSEAEKYPIFEYYRITGGIDSICDVISQNFYVSLGTPWYSNWMSPSSSGLLPNISSRTSSVGGHETFLYGYDKAKGVFFGQNSWGKNWGDKGRYQMPFQAFGYFYKYGGYDAHYAKVNWAKPEPTPEPDPTPPEPKKTVISIYYSIDKEEDVSFLSSFEV